MNREPLSWYLSFCCAALISMSVGCRQANEVRVEFPPSYANAMQNASTVSICELVSDPERYDNQIVRVRAIFFRGMENAYLTDPTCENKDSHIWAEFDQSYIYQDPDTKETLDRILCSSQPCPTGRAEVLTVGRLSGPNKGPYGHLDDYHFKLSIFRVEQVSVAAANTPVP